MTSYFNKSLKQTMVLLQQLPSQCWVELILQQLIGLQEELITCHECLAVCLLTHSVLYPFYTVAALPWFIFCFHPGSVTDLLIDHATCSKRLQYSAGLSWISCHCVPVYCSKSFLAAICVYQLFSSNKTFINTKCRAYKDHHKGDILSCHSQKC